jgi:hypothetical protein
MPKLIYYCFGSGFTDSGCGSRLLLNLDLDPDQSFYDEEFFFFKSRYICLNPDRGQLGSRRRLQPNRELFKHENFLIFPFFGRQF